MDNIYHSPKPADRNRTATTDDLADDLGAATGSAEEDSAIRDNGQAHDKTVSLAVDLTQKIQSDGRPQCCSELNA